MIDLSANRVFFYDNENGVNQLFGLFDLCKKHLTADMVACEIGSFAGVSSNLIASFVKQLFCIDTWVPYPDINNEEYMAESERRFDAVASMNPNIVKLKIDSVTVLNSFPDKYFDFIYIDSWHIYEQVKKELIASIPKIKDGGIIAGHDYKNIPDVAKAVNEIFGGYEIETFSDASWSVKL